MRVHLRKAVDPRSTRAGRSREGMSGNPEREGGGNLAARNPKFQIPCFQVCRFSRGYSSAKSRFRFSEFPGPLRGDPKIQIPCFQVCRFQDTPLQIPDSEFPSFQDSKGPSVGPRSRGGTPISKFLVSSWADSRILLRKFQIPRFRVCRFLEHTPGQIPDSEFPSFRGPLLGPSPRDPQIPDSEFPSFRGPLYGRPQSEGHPYSRFRVSEFPRPPLAGSKPLSKPKGPPNSRFRVSEFPGGPLGSDPEGAQMPDSEIPSFRAAPRAHLARRV